MPNTGLEVSILEVTNKLVANTISVVNTMTTVSSSSNVQINSTAISFKSPSSNTTINSFSVRVGSSGPLLKSVSEANVTIKGSNVTFKKLYLDEVVNVQIFTANGVWQRPAWANTGKELVVVNMWGAGSNAGGGGAFMYGYSDGLMTNQITNSSGTFCNVRVGKAGSYLNVDTISMFYYSNSRVLVAYGGTPSAATWGGEGGSVLGNNNSVYSYTGGIFHGGYTDTSSAGDSIYGGGGTGWVTRGISTSSDGGRSIFGGGGSAGQGGGRAGTSIYGGRGYANVGSVDIAATPPGGGGILGLSARGEVRVFTIRYTGDAYV